MPSNTIVSRHSNNDTRLCMDNSQAQRPSSLALDTIHSNEDEVEDQKSELYCGSKDSHPNSPLHKFKTFSSRRRRIFSRQRSQSITAKFDTIISNGNDAINSLPAVHRLAVTPTEISHRHHSFRDFARNLVEATLQRSNSVNNASRRRKIRRAHTQPVSPLVCSKHGMGRRMVSCPIPGPKDEESNPASVEDFVRKCADCFDAMGRCSKEHFLRILFLTHPWFMTSEQLMVLFSKLYEEEKEKHGYKIKVLFTIRFWMNEFPHMFDLDQNLVKALQDLQISSAGDPDVDSTLIDLNNKNSYKWMSAAQMSIRANCVDRKQRKVSLVFNHLEPEDIAIHMSCLEYNSFRRLTLSDFHAYAVNGLKRENLKLDRVVFLFNNITHWVQCMVLDHHNINDRAQAVIKFVEVAKKLYAMRNFNTLMAIVGALTHTAISRLKKTMAEVPKTTQKTLDEFVELLDSKANYSSYRRLYNSITDEFKIPVVGILMKDMTALHAALPDRVGDGLINVRKMLKIGYKFEEIFRLQRTGFPYHVNKDLVNTLRVSLYLYYNEEEIYQLSMRREPRDIKYSSSGSTSSPTKTVSVGFSEFSCCTCQVDDATIKQHVSAMAQSVFKTYDLNSDGFISEIEFGGFIQNFPGLDPFSTLDTDNDGKISMDEMVKYFLKISSARRNQVCQSFKHDFVEVTYYSPAFCEECDKLLWGLVKQGWKCRICGINCHKHCKDRIVIECRPKVESKQSTSTLHSHKKRSKRKEKASLSSESDLSVNGDIPRQTVPHEDDAFENNDRKSPDKVLSKANPTNLHSAKTFQHSNGKRRTKAIGGNPFSRKTSSPNFSVESKKKLHPFNYWLKKSSPRLINRGPLPNAIDNRNALSSKILYKKARSLEDVNELKMSNLETVNDEDENNTIPNDPTPAQDSESKIDFNRNQTTIIVVTNSKPRNDSLVSSNCSTTVTPSTSSSPRTPLSSEATSAEIRFKYPPPLSLPTILTQPALNLPTILTPPATETYDVSNTSSDNGASVHDHNQALIHENLKLRLQLHQARDVISDLQTKLENLSPTS